MRIAVFIGSLGLGGTGKAACCWAGALKQRGHQLNVLSLEDGPHRIGLEREGIAVMVLKTDPAVIADALRGLGPEIIHAHAPGQPHVGDVLGPALARLPRIPTVQTNIFGRLENRAEDAWTDFRLFISWTSCVQAAQRSFRRLNEEFFRRASVAVYPVAPVAPPPPDEVQSFRRRHGIREDEVLFGRLSRPEPNKWTDLALDAFRLAAQKNRNIRLLLREPPPRISEQLRASSDADRFVILPATADPDELLRTTASLDVVLHTSSMGESFGYGIAEPMSLGKPVVSHSVPWADQAQIELVRSGECGWITSSPSSMSAAMLKLAAEPGLRARMGQAGRRHILALADPGTSVSRLENVFTALLSGRDNPFMREDLERAKVTAAYLRRHRFGSTLPEQVGLRLRFYRTRFHEFRHAIRG